MTDTFSRETQSARAMYRVERMGDPNEIRNLLEPDRAYAAYALAQLDPRLFPLNDWYQCTGAGRALVVHSRSGLGRALFVTGDADALDAVLGLHPGARFSFASLRPEHRGVVEKYYMMTRPQTMLRMSVTQHTFQPAEGEVRHLRGRDVTILNRLYASDGGPSSYRPSHVEEGVYYGVFQNGALVSVAGTHVVSRTEGVAVVGNVLTHPRYRGLGLATIATSAVTADLLQSCNLVVLTVEEANEPAVHAYRRLGYELQCKLHETPLIRKDPTGALSLARRLVAGWRGRGERKEIVLR
jgi:ribosomal protein S18 acetylase RimI-like enzyme